MQPHVVASRTLGVPRLVIPEGTVLVACATDLNVSYAASTVITAFKRDMTAHVMYHEITRCSISQGLNETEYNQRVYNLLGKIAKQIQSLNVKIDGWAIDSGGKNWDAVCSFTKLAMQQYSIPACAFAGRASNIFNPFVKSRLRDAIGRTVLCGSQPEHVKAGTG